MKTKTTIGVVLIVVSLVLGGLYLSGYLKPEPGPGPGPTTTTTSTVYTTTSTAYTTSTVYTTTSSVYTTTSSTTTSTISPQEPTAGSIVSVDVRTVDPKDGEMNTIKTKIKNGGPNRAEFLVEGGIIPKSLADEWGMLSFISLSLVSGDTDCCQGQPNIDDKWVTVDGYGVSDEISLSVKTPYKDIPDLCGDTNYWQECDEFYEDYVAYVVIANKCKFKEGEWQPGYEPFGTKTKDVSVWC